MEKIKKILVTGAKGFIGKNLVIKLKEQGYNVFEYDKGQNMAVLDKYCKSADFVFHLAGVNRPQDNKEYMEGNYGFTGKLLELLKKNNNKSPVMVSSSIQAEYDTPYGKSKKAGEELIIDYNKQTGHRVLIYRFPNVFGKWSSPNYNTVVATFCQNISRDLPIQINDSEAIVKLIYIDDLIKTIIDDMENTTGKIYHEASPIFSIKLVELANLIYSFKDSRETKKLCDMKDDFTKKLYATYLSFLPIDKFGYELKMNSDIRGSFTEFIKDNGQVSVNISKPGIVKGNHYHHTKNEKFLVVSGKGVIRFRHILSNEVIEYFVSSDKLEVVDIPIGYTHNIENIGNIDMVTIMWASEEFDPNNPDTYFLEV